MPRRLPNLQHNLWHLAAMDEYLHPEEMEAVRLLDTHRTSMYPTSNTLA